MLIITMSGCIELIFEGISYYRQKEFFEARKEYSYITVGVRVSSIENAKEMLLRKVQGDNFFIRHKNIIMILLGEWISLIIAAVVCLVLEFTSVVYISVGGILIMTIEHLFVALYSHRLENINISKIFKGGIV